MLKGLISANPGRPTIVQELVEVTRGFERSVYEHNFTKDDVPVVAIGAEAMPRLNIEPAEGFLAFAHRWAADDPRHSAHHAHAGA